MIRFAPQAAEKASLAAKATSEPPKIAAVTVPANEPVASADIERADGMMLLTELPEISGPAGAKLKKARAERKPKIIPQAAVAQLALDA